MSSVLVWIKISLQTKKINRKKTTRDLLKLSAVTTRTVFVKSRDRVEFQKRNRIILTRACVYNNNNKRIFSRLRFGFKHFRIPN